MKVSLRLPFSLLILVSLAAVLTIHVALRRDVGPLGEPPAAAQPVVNTTLVRLALADTGEAELRRDVEELLDGSFAGLEPGRARYRPLPLYRRGAHWEDRRRSAAVRHAIRLRSPKDFRVFPEFRRSLRDWLRLRRFQPGVMSQLLDLVKTPIDRHNRVLSSRERYSSCAVVGNSGILLKSDHGELIDSHELVIRLNNARTQGYTRNVGSKTGLSFMNSNILHLCARRETCFCHPYGEAVPIVMYICQPVHFLDYTLCNASHKAPLLITDPRFDLLCGRIVKYYSLKLFTEKSGRALEEWSKLHDENAFHYSSGMQAVMLAVGICDKVSVFGFGKSEEAKHHYHTNQKAELDLHDYEAEYALYRDLLERPQVIPFLKDSGIEVPPVVFYH